MTLDLVLTAWLHFLASAHLIALLRRARPVLPAPHARPLRAVLVRPLAGDEPGLAARLAHAGHISTVRLCLGTANDGAAPAARRAAAILAQSGVDARVIVTAAHGPNHKIDQVARVLDTTAWDVAVVCDSDVLLADVDLRDALARFADPRLGALWLAALPGPGGTTLGDRATAAVLAGSLHAFPLLAHLDRDGFIGKAFLVRRSAAEAAGGLERLRFYLGEDVELGRRVRAAGYRVALGPPVLRTAPRHMTFEKTVDRFARWLTVIRRQRPALLAAYPLVLAATTPALALAFLLPNLGVRCRIAGLLLLAARAGVFVVGRGLAGLRRDSRTFLVDLVLTDLVLWAALWRSLSGCAIYWRGRILAFDARGRLIDDPPAVPTIPAVMDPAVD